MEYRGQRRAQFAAFHPQLAAREREREQENRDRIDRAVGSERDGEQAGREHRRQRGAGKDLTACREEEPEGDAARRGQSRNPGDQPTGRRREGHQPDGLPAADAPDLFVDYPHACCQCGDFGKNDFLFAQQFGGGDHGRDQPQRSCISRTFFVHRDSVIAPQR